jgi:enterochelin esterase-like enzyme
MKSRVFTACVATMIMVGLGWQGAEAFGVHRSKAVPHGTVHIRHYDSKATGSTRPLHIYTPPGYQQGTTSLPVLYLLHGAGDDDSAWTESGHANQILDTLIAARKAAPMIVVMPLGYAYPRGAGVTNATQRADFEKDLLGDIVPFVEAQYRVLADRDHRALIGLSMGGGQALTIGLHHLDRFSRLAGFSAGVSRSAPAAAYEEVVGDPEAVNSALKLLWLGCGRDDDLFDGNQQLSAFFTAHGITHTFAPSTGDHTWSNWQKYLTEVAPLLWPLQVAEKRSLN